jgi:polar amino acid transport system permease protein
MTTNAPAPDQQIPPEVNQNQTDRPGLIIPWQQLPWWAVIIIIMGVFIGYSMLTNVRYIDALKFILDLPWHREALEDGEISSDGAWELTSGLSLKPGKYILYAEYLDDDVVVGKSEKYRVRIDRNAVDESSQPLIKDGDDFIIINSTRPTLAGESEVGSEVILYDDFSKRPDRILVNLWQSEGIFLTLKVTILSFSVALVLGLIFGLMRVSDRSPDLRDGLVLRLIIGVVISLVIFGLFPRSENLWITGLTILGIIAFMVLLPAVPFTLSTLYVEIIRGLPMLVIVLYMGFAITPALREASRGWVTGEIDLRGIPAAIIGLSIGYGAYMAEVFRGGIESIPRGQMEAARSLGMSYFQAMRYVILPQAIRVILPPLGNDFIAMLKDSSLISVIALPELLQRGRLWISRNFRAFEGFNSVALIYLLMTLVLSFVVRMIERRTSID